MALKPPALATSILSASCASAVGPALSPPSRPRSRRPPKTTKASLAKIRLALRRCQPTIPSLRRTRQTRTKMRKATPTATATKQVMVRINQHVLPARSRGVPAVRRSSLAGAPSVTAGHGRGAGLSRHHAGPRRRLCRRWTSRAPRVASLADAMAPYGAIRIGTDVAAAPSGQASRAAAWDRAAAAPRLALQVLASAAPAAATAAAGWNLAPPARGVRP